jgi:glycosyltransferase involved in cell wall biosynthesis
MGTKPLVSFCFTTYKRPDILIDTVKSILLQKIADWEIIISDNDPEGSGKKITTAFTDDRIKYFPNKENLGMKKSFNKSLERSTGEFIVMIADDDPVYPDMLETLFLLEKKYPGYGMYMGGGDLYCTSASLAKLNNFKVGTNAFLNNSFDVDHIWLLKPEEFINRIFYYNLLNNYLWSSCIVRRNVLIEMGGVPDYGTAFLGDYAYMTVMAAHSGVVVMNKALGRQTIHPENFGRAQNEQLKQAVLGFKEYTTKYFKKMNMPGSVYVSMDRFLGIWVGRHLAFLFSYYKKNKQSTESLIKAEKELFSIPLVKKFYWKYKLKKDFPKLHDAIVLAKKKFS